MTNEDLVAQYDALPIGTEFIIKGKYENSYRKVSETHFINLTYEDQLIPIDKASKRALIDGKSWDIKLPYSNTPKRPIKWV